MRYAHFCTYVVVLLFLQFALTACVINGSVHIPDGSSTSDAGTINGSVYVGINATAHTAKTINGSIYLAAGAHVDNAHAVNGRIKLGQHASAGYLSVVNGSVTLETDATVSGNVTTANGDIHLATGSIVHGALKNVNGPIAVDGAHVGKGIYAVSGDINITGTAVVNGGITVDKPHCNGSSGGCDMTVPRIVIGTGAIVNGTLRFKRQVKLYINDKARVTGPIIGARAVEFSGTSPPTS